MLESASREGGLPGPGGVSAWSRGCLPGLGGSAWSWGGLPGPGGCLPGRGAWSGGCLPGQGGLPGPGGRGCVSDPGRWYPSMH